MPDVPEVENNLVVDDLLVEQVVMVLDDMLELMDGLGVEHGMLL